MKTYYCNNFQNQRIHVLEFLEEKQPERKLARTLWSRKEHKQWCRARTTIIFNFFFIPTHDLVYFQYLDYILQCKISPDLSLDTPSTNILHRAVLLLERSSNQTWINDSNDRWNLEKGRNIFLENMFLWRVYFEFWLFCGVSGM